MLRISRTSDESTNGAVPVNDTTDSPNGAESRTAVAKPGDAGATRSGSSRVVRRSQPNPDGSGAASAPNPPSGHSARRIVTTATIGTRIASCGFTRAATTARIAARSLRAFHSSRTDSSRNTVPKLSTWPQITESNQVIGFDDHDRAGDRRPPLADAEVAGHEVDDEAEDDVGEDRRQLDQVADAAQELADDADQPQGIQVARACSRRRSRGRRSRTGRGRRGWPPRTGTGRGPVWNPDPRSASSPYAMISRNTRPIARIARICQPMPRRGVSSVIVSRPGAPEPRPVTGSLLQSVEGGPEYSRGP